MPGTPQTLPVPPPVSIPTLLNAIRLAAGSGGSSSVAFADITGAPGDNAALAAALALKLDKAGGIITGNGAASTPALTLNGTVFTGGSATTTKPQLLLEPSGTTSTNWSTNGTLFGGNAASGFTGDLFSMQVAAVKKASIDYSGDFYSRSGVFSGEFGLNFKSYGSSFLQIDPTYGVLAPQGSFVVGDGTGSFGFYNGGTGLTLNKIMNGTASPEASRTAPVGSLYLRNNAGTVELWIKDNGTGNTGWIKIY